ncbi:MAG: iron chelate uptake ABC transporter family permease subunit, partial [Planctomycetales bacterium]|nr:iron chelate uptake ABC transporter family permease subunit [Planctomycetales bacterium]
MNRPLLFLLLALLLLALLGVELMVGSVQLPLDVVMGALAGDAAVGDGPLSIVRGIRLPQGLAALFAGMGLAVGGLMMQTVFRNPLAGPSVMGVSSGASLGVALIFLARPLWLALGLPVDLALVLAALTGSIVVLLLVMAADRRIGDGVTLLI